MALDFGAGCIGGIAGLLIAHPFDTVKVKLQTQDPRNPIYRGTWHAFTSIVKTESVKGLYKGITSPMAGMAFVNAILFGLYGNIQRAIDNSEYDLNYLNSHLIAGAVAGFAQSFITGPMELVKIRLQVQKKPIYRSAFDCLIKSAKHDGVRGVFKGMTLTVMREVPSLSTYFYTFEELMKHSEGSTLDMLYAGGMAGISSWLVCYPIDVIKTRIQSDGILGEKPKYKGTMHCLKSSLAEEGHRFLFKGLNSTLIRAFPANGVTFTVVAWIFKLSEKIEKNYLTPPLPDPPDKPEDPDPPNTSQFQREGKAQSYVVHDHDRMHLHNADFSFFSVVQ